MPVFEVQIGYCRGRFRTRYITNNPAQADVLYRGINVGRGYKKRLVQDGKTVGTPVDPDPEFCPRGKRR